MNKLSRSDLHSLEAYAQMRPAFRSKVIAHKRNRQVRLGDNATLYFEDRLTMQYQVQEMLRIERIFEAAEIEQELEAYNPLIPDGSNWKVTFMLQYEDVEQRRVALERLVGVEDRIWVQVAGFGKVHAIADEDLPREREGKTSAVHFLRFELDAEMAAAVRKGAALSVGSDHPAYPHVCEALPDNVRESLAGDLSAARVTH